jgi:hypothetical protein
MACAFAWEIVRLLLDAREILRGHMFLRPIYSISKHLMVAVFLLQLDGQMPFC